jgi:hypothetical protein
LDERSRAGDCLARIPINELSTRRVRKTEFCRKAERCPSRDDGWGEFALVLVPIAPSAIRTLLRLGRLIL